jgi:hypothetical protein
MSAEQTRRALYRFDPHDEGIWLGLGLVRLSMVCGSMLLGALSIYGGHIITALLLLLLVPPCVLARKDGLPLLSWIPLRLLYRLQGPREWALDPEHAGFVTPLLTWVPAIETAHLSDVGDDVDDAYADAPRAAVSTPETNEDDQW